MDLHVFPILMPLPPPSPFLPSGSSQCTSHEHFSHAYKLGWRSVSRLIIYMFQCYSLRTSHPRLLPQSPKVCSIHLCLFFCLACRIFAFSALAWVQSLVRELRSFKPIRTTRKKREKLVILITKLHSKSIGNNVRYVY